MTARAARSTTGVDLARTGAVVALKGSEVAKSRLGDLADPLRRRLAWTMALDTVLALAHGVEQVLVVGEAYALESRLLAAGLPIRVMNEPRPGGMNRALAHGARDLTRLGCHTVVACVGDLPALRAGTLGRILEASARFPRSFLCDTAGTGTTMLIAHTVELDPRFQGRSAAAHHASGARRLNDEVLPAPVPDARRDVDTLIDLDTAFHLGLGPATSALFDPATGRLGRYRPVTVTAEDGAGHHRAITDIGTRVDLPNSALDAGLRTVHPGQRLHATLNRDSVLSAWL